MPPRIVSIGEILWDLLPSGPALGGAPGNLACHARALGGAVSLLSRVGDDDLGRDARARLAARGLNLDGLETDPSAPTGTVEVQLDPGGHPRFTIRENVAWDHLQGGAAAHRAVAEADAICFGTLAQRTPGARATIHALLDSAQSPRVILCDVNLRAPFYTSEVIESSLSASTAVKLNETELPLLAAQFGLMGDTECQMEALARRFALDIVILTLGPAGSRVWCQGEWTRAGGRAVSVRDTVGAGDAFTAALVLGRLLDWPMPRILRSATDIASFVCTQPGATPELPPGLSVPFLESIS